MFLAKDFYVEDTAITEEATLLGETHIKTEDYVKKMENVAGINAPELESYNFSSKYEDSKTYEQEVKDLTKQLSDLATSLQLTEGEIYQQEAQVYTVKAGDNLSKIAQMYGVSVEELAKWNNLDNINLIYPGQTLSIKGISLDDVDIEKFIVADESNAATQPQDLEPTTLSGDVPVDTDEGPEPAPATPIEEAPELEPVEEPEIVESYPVYPEEPGNGNISNAYANLAQIDPAAYYQLLAIVAEEASASSDGANAVATVVINRLCTPGFGSSVGEVLAGGFLPYLASHRKSVYEGYLNNPGSVPQYVIDGVNRALSGHSVVDNKVLYYSGDGVHNYFRYELNGPRIYTV